MRTPISYVASVGARKSRMVSVNATRRPFCNLSVRKLTEATTSPKKATDAIESSLKGDGKNTNQAPKLESPGGKLTNTK